MKILLTGGTGFIGKALCETLTNDGHELIVLTRNPNQALAAQKSPIKYLQWDARTLGDWADRFSGADVVINLAGEPIGRKRWSKFQKEWILNSRVEATEIIIEAISKASPKPAVLINGSAVGYYGDVQSGDVDESYPKGKGFLADVCDSWEKAALEAEKYGVRTVMTRTSLTLERDGGALKRLLTAFELYAGGTPGSGKQWVSWIVREDVIRAIKFIIDNGGLSGAVNITSPNPVTMTRLCQIIGEVLHKPMWVPIPTTIIKAALGEMADMILTGQKVIPRKLTEAGFSFNYPDLKSALMTILK